MFCALAVGNLLMGFSCTIISVERLCEPDLLLLCGRRGSRGNLEWCWSEQSLSRSGVKCLWLSVSSVCTPLIGSLCGLLYSFLVTVN